MSNYIKIKSIKPIGKETVYNMEVASFHNFAVNDGYIVHNCMDSLRYALESTKKKGGLSVLK